jgi:hypothetical protein
MTTTHSNDFTLWVTTTITREFSNLLLIIKIIQLHKVSADEKT